MEEVSVEDQSGSEVVMLKKYFKNTVERILSTLRPGFFTNIKVMENDETIVRSKDIFTFGRNKWDVEIQNHDETNETIRLKDQSVVSTHPKAYFEAGQQAYTITHDYGKNVTHVYSGDDVVAELEYVKRLPAKHNVLSIFSNDIDSRVLLCILYTFEQAQ